MTYQETLAHIFSLGRFGMKPGLERIAPLLNRLGNPQDAFSTVHVVGTNGKGSTASFLSSILSTSGHRTGLFTSPHLISFTERLRIDGDEIPEAAVSPLAERVLAAAPPEATFFEIVTALALLHFAESGVRIAIVEAGMGGRLDATNAVNGTLTVITPVSLDHCEYLGETITEIAYEKAGIVKPGSCIVSARQHPDAAGAIARRAAEAGARLLLQGTDFDCSWDGSRLSYRGISARLDGITPGVPGRYQACNAAGALAAAEALGERGFAISPAEMAAGVEQARWPGRMERFAGPPDLILDGAHNAAGAAALAEALGGIPRGRLLLVVGVMADKELSGILSPLLPLAGKVFAVAPALERALPSDELRRYCLSAGVPAEDAGAVADGIARARAVASPEDVILVAGSLFTVGEARGILISRGVQPFRG